MNIRVAKGFTFIELIITLSVISALGLGATQYYTHQVLPERRADNTASEMKAIKAAALQYHLEYQNWPATITELRDLGLYNGPIMSGIQTPYTFSVTPDGHFSVSVDVLEPGVANRTAGKLGFSSVAGSAITSLEGVPSRETIQTYFLARRVIDGCPECNTMEANINMNGNNIENINEFDAQLARIEEAYIETATIRTIEGVEQIEFDNGNRIASAGSGLQISSPNVDITGSLSLGGALDMQGNDINNVDRLTAAEVFATTGQIDDISGVNLNYVNGTVQILTGQSLNYVTGEIDSLSGVELNYLDGSITNLAGTNLNYSTGWIGAASGNSLNYATGSIGSLTGNTLNYSTGWIGAASGNTLTFNSGNIGSISGNTASYNTFIGNFRGGSAEFSSLSVSGSTALNTLVSQFYSTGTYRANSATASNVNVSNTTTANRLISNNSSLGTAQANNFNITGLLTAAGVNTNLATVQNGQIATVSGGEMTYVTITAGEFQGGTFYGDDFVVGSDSENKIRADLDQRKSELDNCMYVTQYCIPQSPIVNLVCSNCNRQYAGSSFSASAQATISGCRQGCSYTWNTSGSGISFSGCASGTIPPGGGATVQCNAAGTLGPEETKTGVLGITVRNTHYTSRVTTDSEAINWRNTTPAQVCKDDGANYIEETEDEVVTSGGEEEYYKSETIWVWGGSIIYRRVREAVRGTQTENSTTGSTSGYRKGTLTYSDYQGGTNTNYSTARWEICDN